MNVDELVRDALREQAADSTARAPDFADRVLAVRRRRRNRTIACTRRRNRRGRGCRGGRAALSGGEDEVRPASEMNKSDIIGHPDQSPPRNMIAAGDTALSAFYVRKAVKQPGGDIVNTRVYGLLDQKTATYREGKVGVPGRRTRHAHRGRAGGRTARQANRAARHDHGQGGPLDFGGPRCVASVEFSPDGTKLLATTYSKNPDRNFADHPQNVNGKEVPGPVPSRTGFSVVDLGSGEENWHKAPQWKDEGGFSYNSRDDLEWSQDGRSVFSDIGEKPFRQYYGLNGDKIDVPASEKYVSYAEAGLSPNGKLIGGELSGHGEEISSEIVDSRTGERVTTVPGQQLLAWADDERIIAWGCDPKRCSGKGEFRNQLILLTVGSDKVIQLSGFRKASAEYPGRWNPVFTQRWS